MSPAICLLFVALAVALAGSLLADPRAGIAGVSSNDPSHRQARKAMRAGKYEKAAQIYESLVAINGSDLKARLGASFAYLKYSDYALAAVSEVLRITPRMRARTLWPALRCCGRVT